MKEKLIALLIAKFPGVRKDGLTHLASTLALQVATEDEAQALIDKYELSKVTDFVKEWRSGVDSEITTASKTAEEKLKEKFDFVEKKAGAPPTTDPPKDDLDAKLDALVAEKMKPYQDKIAGYEAKEANATRLALITNKAKELNISQKRIEEGFAISNDADEATISSYLSTVAQNEVTRDLPRQEGFAMSSSEAESKEAAKAWALGLPD